MEPAMSAARPSYYPENRNRKQPKVLLICFYEPNGISTVPENVAFLQRHSRFSVYVINMFDWRVGRGFLSLPPEVDLSEFSAVIVHNTVSYNPDNLRSLDKRLRTRFADYRGTKILFKQDENYRFQEAAEIIGRAGFDVVFTCLPPDAQRKIYPQSVAGDLHFERMLTGYVTPTHRNLRKQWGARPLDIAYRGSIQPLDFGRLAYEKAKIGDDIRTRLAGRGLALDISSRWEDRIGGNDWFRFLLSSKITLGAESGASIFDLDGSLSSRIKDAERRHRDLRPDRAAFSEAVLAEVADLEGTIYYNQVSPRHFEAAATGTVQAMYPGAYSDILVAGRHYFELQRDYSNIDDLVALVGDEKRRQDLAEAAHDDIVANPAYWIETFVDRVDAAIEGRLKTVAASPVPIFRASKQARNVLLLAAHEPVLAPRLNWMSDHAPAGLNIVQVGLTALDRAVGVSQSPAGKTIIVGKREPYSNEDFNRVAQLAASSETAMAVLGELAYLAMAAGLADPIAFSAAFGAKPGTPRADDFRWACRSLLETTVGLLDVALHANNVDAIVATGFETLLPGVLASGILGVPLFYDAREYWAESAPDSEEFEHLHWRRLERRLVKFTQARYTVSNGTAELLSLEHGMPFEVLPDVEPLSAHIANVDVSRATESECRFLFQGNFAPHGSIELLIAAWPKTDPKAKLLLRGPDSPHRMRLIELAAETGLLGDRIQIRDPDLPSDLVEGRGGGDVVLLPHPPTGPSDAYWALDNLSRYMSAAIPVLGDKTTSAARMIQEAESGVVANFSDPDDIVAAVSKFVDSESDYRRMAENGRRYFVEKFHWEKIAVDFYDTLSGSVSGIAPSFFELYPKAVGQQGTSTSILKRLTTENEIFTGADGALRKRASPSTLRTLWHLIPKSVRYPLARILRRHVDFP